ncbi:MAG: MmgE/PrpD family protein [Oscillospiraceae bacterium]|nr:MmgE/PrpD family protein [Oscillospiraceae bacterium]
MGTTQILSEYAAGLRFEDLPAAVSEQAARMITQIVGISIAAGDTEEAAVLASLPCREPGPCPAFGMEETFSPAFAALVDGVLADALDWEDCSWTGHPSAAAVPVAWVLGRENAVSGRELITAVTAAYDVYQRIAMSLQPTPEEKKKNGWGLMSWQIFAAVAAGARVLRFTAEEFNAALSLAALTAVLPTALHDFTMSNGYHFEHGMRNYTAVKILETVRNTDPGLLPRDVLDDCGRFAVRYTSAWKPEWLEKDLGTRFHILDTMLKYYPGNMWILPPIDAIMNLRRESGGGPDPEKIRRIVVCPGTAGRMKLPQKDWTPTDIVLNVPFAAANALAQPDFGSCWYSRDNIHKEKMLALAGKVEASGEPEDSSTSGFALFLQGEYPPKTVRVETEDGSVYIGVSHYPPGHPKNPWSREEAAGLYRQSVKRRMSQEDAARDAEALLSIAECPDVSRIVLGPCHPVGAASASKPRSLHNNRHGVPTDHTARISRYICSRREEELPPESMALARSLLDGTTKPRSPEEQILRCAARASGDAAAAAAGWEVGRRLYAAMGEKSLFDCMLMAAVLAVCRTLGAGEDDVNTAMGFAATCSMNPLAPEENVPREALAEEMAAEGRIIAQIAVKGVYHFMDALDDRVVYLDRIEPSADLAAALSDLTP